jgi:hypothetical protein
MRRETSNLDGGSREDVRRFPETAQDSLGFELYRVQCGLDPRDWKPMTSVGPGVQRSSCARCSGDFPDDLFRDATRRGVCIALLPEEDASNEPFGSGSSDRAI